MAAKMEHVVAIGSSAGGLEALQALLGRLREGGSVACLVAQHLAPDHPSQLVDLLGRATPLRVEQAVDGASLEPGLILVLPPNCDATLETATLCLSSPEPRHSPSPSIDRLFQSLAGQWRDHAVGIVLSGTGSDGAQGLRTIAEAGGLTLVQQPETARFSGMPSAAIALNHPDLVAPPGTLAERLCAWFTSGFISSDALGNHVAGEDEPAAAMVLLATTLAQLKQTIGIDFSQYKETTLRRQVQRRMAIRGTDSIEDYLPLLTAEVSEAQALAHNLLVSVTSFFRNPDAFAALAGPLRQLIRSRRAGEPLRVWVPGCASGEEAYSIAMLLAEQMESLHRSYPVQLFSTDIDSRAIAVARAGHYPSSIAADVSPET
jgi:two-component system CheB/CheR fusion protein